MHDQLHQSAVAYAGAVEQRPDGQHMEPCLQAVGDGDAGALKAQAGEQHCGLHHVLVGGSAEVVPGGEKGLPALGEQDVIAQLGCRHAQKRGTVVPGAGVADVVVGEGGLGLNVGGQGVSHAGDHHPGRGLDGDLRVHHHVVRVFGVDHQFGLLMGIVEHGVGGGGRVGGEGGGDADEGLAVEGTHRLADVAGLSAADADDGVGQLRQRLAEVHQLAQRVVGGGAGVGHGPGSHARTFKQRRDRLPIGLVEEGVDDGKGRAPVVGREVGEIAHLAGPLDVPGRGLKGAGFVRFSAGHGKDLRIRIKLDEPSGISSSSIPPRVGDCNAAGRRSPGFMDSDKIPGPFWGKIPNPCFRGGMSQAVAIPAKVRYNNLFAGNACRNHPRQGDMTHE